jgi:hypothetical protein
MFIQWDFDLHFSIFHLFHLADILECPLFDIDIFARAANAVDYSIVGEVKCRDTKTFSKEEAERFLVKFEEIRKYENLDRVIGFVFSRSGFTGEAEDFCKEKGIAYSDNQKWLEKGLRP